MTNKYSEQQYFTWAFALSIFTIFYNLIEGMVASYYGIEDDTLVLFGFGLDSFIEIISGVGILYMVWRIRRAPQSPRSHFEVQALRLTGTAFVLLVIGLSFSVILNFIYENTPETTVVGLIVSIASIIIMTALIYAKVKVGKALDSAPILADANCTRACLYMSVVLLLASALYELTAIRHWDLIGSIGIIYFASKEAKECFDKAKGKACCDSGCE
ncbi:MAG: cation transporter [Bernardetiaceae bacterium]|nr:cation transporter [Bernardetiaceae bacterium]